MPRYCFTLQVRPDRLDEYVERHRAVWPEMLRALAAAGWRDYTLHLRADGLLVGIVTADDLAAAQDAMTSRPVNERWQAEMAPYFQDLDDVSPDLGLRVLPKIFDLEGQLAAVDRAGARA
ncbi:MAG: L-rhamnose mutarotase [Kineosporiaceae bacterium]